MDGMRVSSGVSSEMFATGNDKYRPLCVCQRRAPKEVLWLVVKMR